ncbi:multiprotein Na+/H+ antiporter/ subunit D [Synechococcus sp. RS9909]|uniref:proton-conducting transporter transmembrane domain-containing protein n=1 Tax=unclassified Synechococcus TaxID=2626047 RepID=UPI000068F5D8|nr:MULTISPECIES: proton-conducting transporter membrane subunit [unclassified Synechococcus]EAQ69957.1 NADH dehydrogenase subunit N [Synechococcus sp. RS9917]QNI79772.1 multiprotein Na+/H+ antiporter/ subunit D [Synechococcus sp. RS9909]
MSPLALPITALLGPYLAAFLNALLPFLGRPLLLACSLSSAGLGLKAILSSSPQLLAWLGPLGVKLSIDPLAGWFLLLDGLVFCAVLLDGWSRPQRASQLTLMLVLLGGLGGAAVVTDLISLYVTLEVISIAAFLLILSETDTNLWIGLRYLLFGNTAMTLYLVGAALLYAQTESFGLSEAASLPLCAGHVFLLIGLFTKGGLFLNGFWLPATHAAAAAPISALLSGSVVTAGVIPLVRFSLLNEPLALRIGTVGLASALLGVIAGLICTDVKRLLAWSTLSQMGLLVLMPASAGLFGLAHGLAKAALFLSCRQLPTRALAHWNLGNCRPDQRLAFWLAPLSLAGLPPLIGALAKTGTPSLAGPWLAPLLSLIAILAIAAYARLWSRGGAADAPGELALVTAAGDRGWSAGVVLLLALLWLPLLRPTSLTPLLLPTKWLWLGANLAAGLLLHQLLQHQRQAPTGTPSTAPPFVLERLEHLIGGLGLMGSGLLLSLPGGWPR